MDRVLKERVIGAGVLVAFAVLVVPVFLDGPSIDTEIVSEPVTLPGQNDQTRRSQTIVLDRDRTEPVPTSSNGPEIKPAEGNAKAAVVADKRGPAPAKNPPKSTADKAPAVSPTGMWAVQLGSFSNQANADRLAADLRDEGYAAFLSQLRTESGPLHRVRIGPQKDRGAAEAIAARLKSDGHIGQVVTHP
ncbi:MAG: SPOR domain-containing protein [Woeseia sp.]